MSSASADDRVRARIAALVAELGLDLPLLSVTDLSTRLGVVEGVLADRVLALAVTESGRLRLGAELRGRLWAQERGIAVPDVLAAADDGRWLLSRRVQPGGTRGERWVAAAVAAALAIAPLPAPPGEPWTPPQPRALGRARLTAEDTGRLLRGGLRLGELRAVRAAARQLPLAEVAHGDYRAANAVLDEDQDRVVVLEWAGVSSGPRHADLLTLWATTPGEEERELVADAVRQRTARWEEPDVGVLWHAVALEQLVSRLTRPDRGDGLDADFARARLAEARRAARGMRAP